MLEGQLITAVNKYLTKLVHHQSMTSASLTQNGTPDRYYDGPAGDLWVEYKMLDAMPRSGLVGFVDAKKKGCYSPLQYEWMMRRYSNSLAHARRNVVGIVGLPNRTAVIQRTPTEWREGTSITQAISLKEVGVWIDDFCSQSYAPSAASS